MDVTPHRLNTAILAAVLAIVLVPLQLVWIAPATAETTQITDGSVTWGVKASWRGYAGAGAQSDGVTQNGDGEYVFPVVEGSYDDETGTTTVSTQGTVHWQGHWYPNESSTYAPPAGYTGTLDLFVLDVTLSDPVVTLSAEGAEVTVEMVSRDTSTWEVVDYGRVPLASLDFSSVTPAVTSSTTTWSDLPAAWTEAGVDAIGYTAGLMVDPLSITYAGPGGAPDVSESWTPAGSTGIEYVDHTADTKPSIPAVLWVDADRRLAHVTWSTNVDGVATRFVQAYDLTTLAAVGTPFTVTGAERNRIIAPTFFDSTSGSLYYSSVSLLGPIDRTLTFDPETATYTRTVLASPTTMQGSVGGVLWDPVRERAITVTRVVPGGVSATDYDLHEWRASTYTRGEDGGFTEQVYVLPNGPTGWNRTWYGPARSGAVSSDGSIILPRENVVPAAGAAPLTGLEAHHITLGDSTVAVAEIGGTSLPEAGTDQQSLYGYNLAVAGPGGRVYLIRLAAGSAQTKVLQVQIDDGNAAVDAAPVDLGSSQPRTFSVDRTDGTLWGQAINNQHVVGVRDGRVVNDTYSGYINPKIQGIVVDGDRSVFTVSYDGEPLELGETPGIGFARFDRLGVSPTVTTQPAAVPVTLGTGQTSVPVVLTAAAEGEPAPGVQWQRKAPGSSRFSDLDGRTTDTLTVDATRASDQAQYRAVFTNAAGRIATDVVTLDVRSAPLIETQPADHRVTAGAPATFTIQASGSPEPDVTWQRRVAGFWQDLSTDDDVAIDDGTLVVSSTNVDQSGSLFRAKVRNSVDTVFSRTAKLTVEPALTAPQVGTGGTLTWGVKESFRTYATGPIAQGAITVTGATTNPDGTYAFPVKTGAYDPSTGKLTVETTGAVRFTGHHGSLDLTISNLSLRHDGPAGVGDDGVLVADVVSKDQSTGQLVTYDDLELATVDSGSGDSAVPGLLTVGSRATTLTGAGAEAFAGFYSAGATMDPISGAVEIADASTTPPARTTTTTVQLAKGTFTYGSTTSALVRVTATGASTPSGEVTLATAGRTVTGVLADGSARLQLPAGIDPGSRTLRVTYAGTATTTGSSAQRAYRVVRAEPTIKAAYRRVGRTDQRGRVQVRVSVPKAGQAATGQLLVRDRGRVVAAVQLHRSDRGRVVVTLPRLRTGRHVLTVSLAASDRYQAVRTTTRIIRVAG
jgi:hypothetical protein